MCLLPYSIFSSIKPSFHYYLMKFALPLSLKYVWQYQINYSRSAPHIVYSTNALSKADINLGLKLSAVLSRIVNSPMRSLFFKVWSHSGENLRSIIEKIYGRICESEELAKSRLVQDESLYDSYWNDEIYREIPTKFVDNLLRSY